MNATYHYDYTWIDALASIGFKKHNYPLDVDEFLEETGVELQTSVNMHTSNYDRIKMIAQNPVLIKSKSFYERQKAQSGYYILFFNSMKNKEHPVKSSFENKNGYCFEEMIDEIDKEHSEFVSNIIKIPSSYKEEICLQLKLLNIDVSTLFPEDIDRGCKMLVDDICNRRLKEIITV